MVSYIGDYPCKIDAKGRIVLPVTFKKQTDASQDRYVLKKDIFEKCLILYPGDEWENQVTILRNKLNPYNKEHNKFSREFYKGTAEITIDSSGRLLIPRRLLEEVEIEKEVILAGQDTKIEIWAKHLYDAIGTDENEFARLAETILGAGE